jgi:hypothetical protein
VFNSRSLIGTRRGIVPNLALRTDTAPVNGYFPLDPDRLDETDGVIFVREV